MLPPNNLIGAQIHGMRQGKNKRYFGAEEDTIVGKYASDDMRDATVNPRPQ